MEGGGTPGLVAALYSDPALLLSNTSHIAMDIQLVTKLKEKRVPRILQLFFFYFWDFKLKDFRMNGKHS